ncbi:MAG: hypothetical protein AB1798_10230 [Spirochaetota bacterium]
MSVEKLCKAVETGDQEESRRVAQKLIDGGAEPLSIITTMTLSLIVRFMEKRFKIHT